MKYLKAMAKDGWGVSVYPKYHGYLVTAHKAGVGDIWTERYSLRAALKDALKKVQDAARAAR